MLFALLILFVLFSTPQAVYSADVEITAFSPITDTEWVQITNNSSAKIVLDNWKFIDNSNTAKPLSGCIEAGKNRTFQVGSGWMNNGSEGDTIKLVNSSGGEIHTISYSSALAIGIPSSNMAWYYSKEQLLWQEGSSTNFVDNPCTMPTSTPSPTTAAPSPSPTTPTSTPKPEAKVTIETFPSTAHVNQSFAIRFKAENLQPNTDYYFKGIGGINDVEVMQTYNNGNWYGYRDSWDNHPKFKSNSDGKINETISIRVKDGQSAGEYKIKIKSKELDKESELVYVTISDKLPTSTPSPTQTPTSSLSPTPTEEEPTPTIEEEFNLLANDSDTDNSNYGAGQILGDFTSPTPAPSTKKTSGNIFPIVLMITGGLLLLLPLAITKLKNV
jgi:hypothetical protein